MGAFATRDRQRNGEENGEQFGRIKFGFHSFEIFSMPFMQMFLAVERRQIVAHGVNRGEQA
jgi:hypothetical protein